MTDIGESFIASGLFFIAHAVGAHPSTQLAAVCFLLAGTMAAAAEIGIVVLGGGAGD